MDEENTSHHLNAIKEMILDEEKLITYTTISRELCIHVNMSKFLLNAVVEDITKNKPKINLNVNYIISGLCDSNEARTTVCSQNDIQSVKNTFKRIFFEHIYSVSKGLPGVDKLALMMINKFEDFSLCVGSIKSSSCIKRTTNEIASLKTNHQDDNVTVKPQKSKSITETKIKAESSVTNNTNDASEPKKAKSMPTIKKEDLSPSKGSLVQKSTNKPKLDNKTKSQKNIAGFFNKQIGNQKTVQKTKETLKSVTNGDKIDKNNIVKDEKMENDEEEALKVSKSNSKEMSKYTNNVKPETVTTNLKMEMDAEDPVKVSKSNSIEIPKSSKKVKSETVACNSLVKDYENKKKSKNKSLNEIKKNAQVDKKRKRVLLVSDSESDEDKDPFADDIPVDVEENQEPEDEIPPTPTINTVKITSGIMNPKKRRKIVDKTYTDDEGYILTKKVEVYESCSDNEEEIDKKENVQNLNHLKKGSFDKKQTSPKENKKEPKNPKKKISPQSGKQATLMNFFKKV